MQGNDISAPIASDSNSSREDRWSEIRDLAVRGILHAKTLSAAEVAIVSSLALLALGLATKRTVPSGPQRDQRTP